MAVCAGNTIPHSNWPADFPMPVYLWDTVSVNTAEYFMAKKYAEMHCALGRELSAFSIRMSLKGALGQAACVTLPGPACPHHISCL